MNYKNKCNGPTCPKGGVKIHESNNDYKMNPHKKTNNNIEPNIDQSLFYEKLKMQNRHTGVRIEDNGNTYSIDPFDGLNPFSNPNGGLKETPNVSYNKSAYNALDLNIESYSKEDLFNLFGLTSMTLNDDIMREAKKIVLKTHPDKSHLEPKFFLFFSKAYKRLYSIYEFQNKMSKKTSDNSDHDKSGNNEILNRMFEKNNDLKKPDNFNKWFNDQFEKHRIENPLESGYGEWLKSDDGIMNINNVSQANIGAEMEKIKHQVKSMVNYTGVKEITANSFGGTTLMETNNNFSSESCDKFTDLRQAYLETVIPVTNEDYEKIPKYKNVNEYKTYRNSVNIAPTEKEESMKILFHKNQQMDEESAALAYYYAKQAEKTKQNQESFWAGLKQITNTYNK
jgi:hypothetical protein